MFPVRSNSLLDLDKVYLECVDAQAAKSITLLSGA
jgi:hypothetical protein